MSRSLSLAGAVLSLTVLLPACTDAPTAPAITPMASVTGNEPVTVPIYERFDDINYCGNQIVTYTFEGSARIVTQGALTVITSRGTVTTSDGFAGTFNRTFVFRGDQVLLMRFHDMEVNSATGERQVFGLGMYLVIAPNGTTRVEAELYAGGHCVSPGA